MGTSRAFILAAVAVAFLPALGCDGGGQSSGGSSSAAPAGFFNVLPPGQDGGLNSAEVLAALTSGELPPHAADQLDMYEGIVFDDATPGMTREKLGTYFKEARLGRPVNVERAYRPGDRDDVIVFRDAAFGVAHVEADTREGAMFAMGYTGAEDRLFLMDVLRHVGRAELAAFLGASPGNLALDADQLAVAPYTEDDLTAQVEAIGATMPDVLADGEAYIAGVNRFIQEALIDPTKLPGEYPALQLLPSEFVAEDIVAIASLVGGIFGKGGGGEVRNFCGLEAVAGQVGGAATARAIFDDLKFADDPEAPRTIADGEFSYLAHPAAVDPAALPDIDCASLAPIEPPAFDPGSLPGAIVELVPTPPLPPAPPSSDAEGTSTRSIVMPWGEIPFALPTGLSNALLVTADRSAGGVPIAVFGPQTGYFIPQLLVEKSVIGPGIAARGAAFAGTDLYVQLGRGLDYAWSATSASGDNVDQVVLRLCEPGGGTASTTSRGYRHQGTCKPIDVFTTTRIAKPSAGGTPEGPDVVIVKHFERAPDYGPLTARGTTKGGTPIAIAVRRSTYGSELASARGFRQINDPTFMAGGVDAFRAAMGEGVDYTFNWFYVDREHVAYQFSCLCPERAQGVDPYLPVWGTGQWDWTGFLSFAAKPHELDPATGFLVSWNNKQALGFRSNDRQFGWGPVHRSQLLERRLRLALDEGDVDVGAAVDVMALAATTDLRAQELLPLLDEVMGGVAPPGVDPRVQEMRDRLVAWAGADFGHRRDHDRSGAYDVPQPPAILDAWWPLLVDAIFAATSGDAFTRLGIGIHDAPQNHLGSAFQDSAYAHVAKDLRRVREVHLGGEPVESPFSRIYCGGGDLVACRDALWGSLDDAVPVLVAEFGSDVVADWQRSIADDDIRHSAVGVASVRGIHWHNRPTFQQVVQVGTE